MNIILFGYRGSGKTSIGMGLAERLGMSFVDVDQQACQIFGNDSIADIWQVHGEPAWRQTEIAVTQTLCGGDRQVIALGGGTLMQDGAREAVEQADNAVRVYLYATTEVLYQRISQDAKSAKTRPALTQQGGDLEEVKQVLAARDPVYRATADHLYDVSQVSIAEATDDLMALVGQPS